MTSVFCLGCASLAWFACSSRAQTPVPQGQANAAVGAPAPVAAPPRTAAVALPGWKLVWADEFDRDGAPDPANWNFERGFVRNEEAQWYQAENARVENGLLVIEARRERRANPRHDAASKNWKTNRAFADYTSASLKTAGKHAWTYGRFELRARIGTADGLWPAFWTVGQTGRWPAGGEIDIMEFYRGKLLANVAWGTAQSGKAAWDSSSRPVTEFGDDWARKFHVWRMDWDEKFIRLYVDDFLLKETDLAKTLNADGSNPFHDPQFIILNLAIGGRSGGDPSKTAFPSRFEVDWVRVYRKVPPAGPSGG